MKQNNIDFLERSEAFNRLLALSLSQQLELKKLNDCILRKNHSIAILRNINKRAKERIETLRNLPGHIIERNMETGETIRVACHPSQLSDADLHAIATAKVPPGNEHLDELVPDELDWNYDFGGDSENPDSTHFDNWKPAR